MRGIGALVDHEVNGRIFSEEFFDTQFLWTNW